MKPMQLKPRFRHSLAAVLLAFTPLAGCNGRANALATVNGKTVDQAEFDAFLKLKHISPADTKRREQALDEYLNRAALTNVIENEQGFERAAVDAELAELKKELVLSRYFDRFLDQKVTDEAVKNYYDAHLKDYEQRKVHAAHILVRTNPKMSDEEKKAKRTTVQDIYAKLQTGKSFEELAQTLSDDRVSGAKGGDLGWLREGSIAPEFSAKAFAMKAGSISEPFETAFGFHVLKLLEEPKIVRKPLSAALGDIRYQLRAEAKEAELKRLTGKVAVKKKNAYKLDEKALAASSASPAPRPFQASMPPPPVEPPPAAPVEPATAVAPPNPAPPALPSARAAVSINHRPAPARPAPAPSH
jgi:peptidyl-prolyl cis-trans isomerase C